MLPRHAKTLVRTAAALTALLSLTGFSVLAFFAFNCFVLSEYRWLAAAVLFSVVPLLSSNEAIRAWRYDWSGITSIAAVLGVLGVLGAAFSLHSLAAQLSIWGTAKLLGFLIVIGSGALVGKARSVCARRLC